MQHNPNPTINGAGVPAPAPAKITEIAVILDRFGSMEAIATDAIGGFNAFVACQQRLPGEARMSLILSDDRYEVPIKSQPLAQVPHLARQTFVPRGSTAVLDAIGRTIKKLTESFVARPAANRPDTIIVAILTDGEENASRTFSLAHIADLIAEKRAQGWEFVFLAANQDAIASATRLSIPAGRRPGKSGRHHQEHLPDAPDPGPEGVLSLFQRSRNESVPENAGESSVRVEPGPPSPSIRVRRMPVSRRAAAAASRQPVATQSCQSFPL